MTTITIKRAILDRLIDAWDSTVLPKSRDGMMQERMEDLRAALSAHEAEPEREPMFWVRIRSDGMYEGPIHNAQIESVRKESGAWKPLYLHPSAPERKPMTDEKAYALAGAVFPYSQHAKCLELIRDVEAFHGITKG